MHKIFHLKTINRKFTHAIKDQNELDRTQLTVEKCSKNKAIKQKLNVSVIGGWDYKKLYKEKVDPFYPNFASPPSDYPFHPSH
jgi:hypothetical protein